MEKLTNQLALEKVEAIKEKRSDAEAAHSMEDGLYSWFIKCVAADMYTIKEAVEIANTIKQTENLEFDRWCA